MRITGTHFNYYLICHRKLWLFANGIQMEQTSDAVQDGKLIHESSYADRALKYKEIEMDGIKIDYFDPNEKVVHEIKRSKSSEKAHVWQVKYYLYKLLKAGIEATGLLEYPKLRKTDEVTLRHEDIAEIEDKEYEIEEIIEREIAPDRITKISFCKKCAYYDFCWVEEETID